MQRELKQGQDGLFRPERRIHLPPTVKRGIDTIWGDYNEINPDDSEDEAQAKVEQWIAVQVGTVLMKEYPQREWKVIVDVHGGMLIVGCDSICNHKGYHIKLDKTIDELQRRAVMAAGEILERHNIARSKRFDPAQLDELARDAFDSVISADSEAEPI